MGVEKETRRGRTAYLVAWLLAIAAIVLVAGLRIGLRSSGPAVAIVGTDGRERAFSLETVRGMPALTRRGVYQNQYGNWRDEGVYVGVLLVDLIGRAADYTSVRVVANDGYEMTIGRARLEDPAFPVVLAYALDGVAVPTWIDGFRIAVLPEDGNVGNEEYGVESAGSYWVKNVERIILQ